VIVVGIVGTLVVLSGRGESCSAASPGTCGARCDEGDGPACRIVAEQHHRGSGVAIDHEAGRTRDARGCQLGYAPSCFELGKSLRGVVIESKLPAGDPRTQRRVAEMADALRRGCDGGVLASCRSLGREYSGFGTPLLPYDPEQSFALVGKACSGLDATSCKALHDMVDDARHPQALRDAGRATLAAACAKQAMPGC
jgi:hypothetical protein